MVTISVRTHELVGIFYSVLEHSYMNTPDKEVLLLKLYKSCPNGYFKAILKDKLIAIGVIKTMKVRKLATK